MNKGDAWAAMKELSSDKDESNFYGGKLNTMSESQKRKNSPVFSGVLMYFPDAIMTIAEHSKKSNDKHNPGEPMHWAKEKSKDHADCAARHLIDIGPTWDALDDETGSLHATALAWRALALLQTVLDREKITVDATTTEHPTTKTPWDEKDRIKYDSDNKE